MNYRAGIDSATGTHIIETFLFFFKKKHDADRSNFLDVYPLTKDPGKYAARRETFLALSFTSLPWPVVVSREALFASRSAFSLTGT